MSDNEHLRLFTDGAQEYLQQLNNLFLELEKNPGDHKIIKEINRLFHSLKGMSAAMGFEPITVLTHKMEDIFSVLMNNPEEKVSPDVIGNYFHILDVISQMIRQPHDDFTDEFQRCLALLNVESPKEMSSETGKVPSEPQKFYLHVVLDDGCLLKAARAFVVYTACQKIGKTECIPDIEKIISMGDNFEGEFSVVIETSMPKQVVEETLMKIPEIDHIEFIKAPISSTEQTIEANERVEQKKFQATARPRRFQKEAFSETQFKTREKRQEDKSYVKTPIDNRVLLEEVKTLDIKKEKTHTGPQPVKSPVIENNNALSTFLKVDINKLDAVINLVEELVIVKNTFEQFLTQYEDIRLTDAIHNLSRVVADLQENVMNIRMVNIGNLFQKYPRFIRDLCRSLNKDVKLIIQGEDTELDRGILERIDNAMIHLLRNAIDHGIETPEERMRAGKSAQGVVIVSARRENNQIVITVKDDGRGINFQKVYQKAIQKGLLDPAIEPNETSLLDCLFQPGFSSRDDVSEISGRGLGLDIVKKDIENINGMVEIKTVYGQGTTFNIYLPLTVAIIKSMLVMSGEEIYAVPFHMVEKIAFYDPGKFQKVNGSMVYHDNNRFIKVINLNRVLGHPDGNLNDMELLILQKGDMAVGILVDKLLGQQEVVVKPLAPETRGKFFSGVSILSNGRMALILDTSFLFHKING